MHDPISPTEWDYFVQTHPAGHVLQTSRWGQHQAQFGWKVERVTITTDQVVAGAQVLFRRLAPGLITAYIPKGPLMDWNRPDICSSLWAAIHRLCRSRRALWLKIEPDLPESPELAVQLMQWGLIPAPFHIQPRRTIWLDLTPDLDEIFSRIKSKCRYNVRLSERKGVQVYAGQRKEMDIFNQLRAVTGQRDDFHIHDPAYYDQVYELLVAAGYGQLFIAHYEGQPLAAIIILACGGKAWYVYGASSNEHRERMPNHAIQWAAIRWAKERGCKLYDLWGIPDEDPDTLEAQFAGREDGLWGVYRFKRGWGGQIVRYIGAFDYVYNRPLYALYRYWISRRSR